MLHYFIAPLFLYLLFCPSFIYADEDLFKTGEFVGRVFCARDGNLNHGPALLMHATTEFIVMYHDVPITIKNGETFYVHKPSWEENPRVKVVCVGWHGTIRPPHGM